VQRTPKSFDFLKIWAKFLKVQGKSVKIVKIYENSHEILEILGKLLNIIQIKMAQKLASNVGRNTFRHFFLMSSQKYLLCGRKSLPNFFIIIMYVKLVLFCLYSISEHVLKEIWHTCVKFLLVL